MKAKILFLTVVFCITLLPVVTYAESENLELVSEITKYYKTITYYDSTKFSLLENNSNNVLSSKSFEISEEEYLTAPADYQITANPVTSVTTYKKMTSSIYKNGNYYRYKNELEWKNMPATRSIDIIAIGFFQSVKIHGDTHFLQEYCYTNGTCSSSSSNNPQIFSSGAGTSFQLPSGSLTSLKQTFYFDVEKNTTLTIVSQYAYSDYSHATKTITSNNAKKYTVSQSFGIVLDSAVEDYYDVISPADASWEGTW